MKLNKEQLKFLGALDDFTSKYYAPTCETFAVSVGQSKASVSQRLRCLEVKKLVMMEALANGNKTWLLTDLGKQAINGHAKNQDKLDIAFSRLTQAWPFHLHEIYQDTGYGADVHNKHDRLIASFRNVERARAFMTVIEELLKGNGAR